MHIKKGNKCHCDYVYLFYGILLLRKHPDLLTDSQRETTTYLSITTLDAYRV